MATDLNPILSGIISSKGEDLLAIDPDFLTKTIEARWTSLSLKGLDAYCDYMKSNQEEITLLLHALSNTYTQFFRNPLTFATLEAVVLPKILASKQRQQPIRIWSAGCSTGQEPYSLAMILSEVMDRNGIHLPFHIFATDINEEALSIAKVGCYSSDDIGNLTKDRIEQHFTHGEDGYCIGHHLRKKVSFSVYNLLQKTTGSPPEAIFGDFDLIMCSNVLIYGSVRF